MRAAILLSLTLCGCTGGTGGRADAGSVDLDGTLPDVPVDARRDFDGGEIDTDRDGIYDRWEVWMGTDPRDAESIPSETDLEIVVAPCGLDVDPIALELTAPPTSRRGQDVALHLEGYPGNPEGFDVRRFVASIAPTTFVGVPPGAVLPTTLQFRNDERCCSPATEVFMLRVTAVADDVVPLDSRFVAVIVPSGCPHII